MKIISIRKGLNLPITGEPDQEKIKELKTKKVALLGADYIGMKPTMAVAKGDTVKKGQLLFTDKKMNEVKFTSPASGKVVAINRGERRVFESVVIEVSGEDEETFTSYAPSDLDNISEEKVKPQLIDSGLWTSLRARPYSKVANPADRPKSIFINVSDSNPLAVDPSLFVRAHIEAFKAGVKAISALTDQVFVCGNDETVNLVYAGNVSPKVQLAQFLGPHPSGLVGTHIHFLDPVNESKTVWHINYADVVSVGYLFLTGKIFTERLISLAGPAVKEPMLIKTTLGADVNEIVGDNKADVENRIISGSVFSGNAIKDSTAFLGRYHNQISILAENKERVFLGWQTPGFDSFSTKRTFLSKLNPLKKFAFTTNTNGSPRAMVPIGMYENVMPLDILPAHLLRALVVKDTESAVNLGAIELDEEDVALCTFVCPGKTDYGPILRENLVLIEKGE